ncbi:Ribosome maturation factor RimM [Candidatus Magnetomoraceae bacterium gMMP-15]
MKLLNKFDKELILAAKAVGVHGVRGVLKIVSYVEEELLSPGLTVYMCSEQGEKVSYTIESAKPHNRTILLYLKEIKDRSLAEALRGFNIFIDRTLLPSLDKDTYYWFEIQGLKVFNSNGHCLGQVSSIISTGSNDVYAVTDGEHEILVPALESVVKKIDLENKLMQVDLPEGL